MSDLHSTVASALADRYATNAAHVRELAGALSNSHFWQKPFSFGNSFGHLVLHLTGNLNYYIGTEVAGTGYVRDRDREFSEAAPPAKDEVLKRFADAVAMVARAARAQAESDWGKPYKAVREEDAENRFNIFLRCATHLQLHVGQMLYLQFELMRGKQKT